MKAEGGALVPPSCPPIQRRQKVALWRHLTVLLSCYPEKAEGGASCPLVSSGKTI